MATIHYFINGGRVTPNEFQREAKELKTNKTNFSIEDRHYWEDGKHKHLQDLVYGKYELRPVEKGGEL